MKTLALALACLVTLAFTGCVTVQAEACYTTPQGVQVCAVADKNAVKLRANYDARKGRDGKAVL